MRPLRILATVTVVALAACASGGASAGATGGGGAITQAQFAPAAEVSLSAMTAHPRGFYFRDLRVGDGEAVRSTSTVRVDYVVRLADGTAVDRSDPQAPLTIRLGRREAIAAFEVGLQGMREGGVRQLVVPPSLGYGRRGTDAVPPNATLVMVVQLAKVD